MNDSPWFRHDSNADDDPKMQRLLFKYGNAGCGVYWRIAQRLRGQVRLLISDIPILAKSIDFPNLSDFIDDCCEWGLYERDDSIPGGQRGVIAFIGDVPGCVCSTREAALRSALAVVE